MADEKNNQSTISFNDNDRGNFRNLTRAIAELTESLNNSNPILSKLADKLPEQKSMTVT